MRRALIRIITIKIEQKQFTTNKIISNANILSIHFEHLKNRRQFAIMISLKSRNSTRIIVKERSLETTNILFTFGIVRKINISNFARVTGNKNIRFLNDNANINIKKI
jgi:hypothetical protein